MSQNVRIHDLIEYIKQGKIVEAIEEFYADDVVMTEPAYGETVGKAANVEREKKFVASLAAFKNFEVTALATSDDVSLYECVMDWKTTDGQDVHVEQVAVARWRDGKIVHERFYYNVGA